MPSHRARALVRRACGLVELVTERGRNVRWSCELGEPAAAVQVNTTVDPLTCAERFVGGDGGPAHDPIVMRISFEGPLVPAESAARTRT